MRREPRIVHIAVGGVFLFGLDQGLKFLAMENPEFRSYLIRPWLGWEYFENTGIAFSLPFPNLLLIIVTPLLLGFMLRAIVRETHAPRPRTLLGTQLLFFGALSNFIDRLRFGATIDYIRVATSVVNLADIMIVLGVLLLLIRDKKSTASECGT